MVKKCTACEEVHPISNFHKQKQGKYGVTSRCKPCERIRKIKQREELLSRKSVEIPIEKRCLDCKEVKSSDEFTRTLTVKDGLYPYCKSCSSKRDRTARERNSIEGRTVNSKKCPACNKVKDANEFFKSSSRYDGLYGVCKKCKCVQSNQYTKKRIKTDLSFRIARNLRIRLSQAVRGKSKCLSLFNYLGCSVDELKSYLESKFVEGMNWENYGKTGWHIDHILPLSSFNLENEEEFRKATHFSNLQPLWASENYSKGSKIL